MQFSFPHTLDVSPLVKLAGISLFVVGLVMVLAISFMLNFEHLMGLRFFYPTKAKRVYSSLFRILNNPMYDGFFLILLGCALWFDIVQDFYIAFAIFLLLNIFLANVENYELKWNPF